MKFVLTDETIDSYGERILVNGVKLDRFEKNPIMLYQHDWYNWDYEPIGHWENIRVENNQLVADAVFGDSELSQKIQQKVEEGTLSGCSVGVRVLNWSDKDEDKVVGQSGWTITECELIETSIVNIPANPNAVADRQKYFVSGEETKSKKMVRKFASLQTTIKMKKEEKTIEELNASLQEKDAKIAELEAKIADSDALKVDFETKVKELTAKETELTKLNEQIEAFKASDEEKAKKISGFVELEAKVKNLEADLSEAQENNTTLIKEMSVNVALAGLVFDANSKERNLALKDACVSAWEKQFRVEEVEGTFKAFSKKEQKTLDISVEESVKAFAFENGYAQEKVKGLGASNTETKTKYADITWEDKNNPEKAEAYKARKKELRVLAQKQGIIAGSSKEREFFRKHNMLKPAE